MFFYQDGRSALHRAAENGGVEVLTILLDVGANVNAADEVISQLLWFICINRYRWLYYENDVTQHSLFYSNY